MRDNGVAKLRAAKRHLDNLVQSHRDLDQKIIEAHSNTSYDKIKEMKYEKLQLKKTITWFENEVKKMEYDQK